MEEARQKALEEEVERQVQRPPLTIKYWKRHIYNGIYPAPKYLFQRFSLGGDWHDLVECLGAQ